jgi:O-antigen ligase
MSDKFKPLDYEPITRHGQKALGERELDESFGRSRDGLREDGAGEWPARTPRFDESAHEEPTRSGAKPGTANQSAAKSAGKEEGWASKHGHALSFAGLFLFTLVLYFRPYELFESLSGFTSLAFWLAVFTLIVFVPTQLGLEQTLTSRPREVNLILLLALIGLIGVPFALDQAEAWGYFIEFLKVVLMFIVMINVIRTERRLKAMILLGLAAGCLVSIGALNDYRLGQLRGMGERVAGIIGGMFDNANDMALYLVMMLPLAVALLLSSRGVIKKLIYGACALVMIAANLITFSRGGFFGLISVLLFIAWKFGRRHRLSVMISSLLCGGLIIVFMPGGLTERLASTFGAGTSESAASAVGRWHVLLRSVLVSLYNPLLGVGMGNFHHVSIREQVSHNAYTQVSAEMGFPALVIYVMLIWAAFRRLRRIEQETLDARRKTHFYYLSVGLQGSLVGYLVGSCFASVAYLYYLYYPIGYAVCLHFMYKSYGMRETGALIAGGDAVEGRAGKLKPSSALPRPANG